MTRPHITVIVPSFDRSAYLERTICSVLDQPWDGIELLVVAGGNRAHAGEVIARYADEIAWSSDACDAGPADAINRALAHVTGEVVGILPAGDLYLPETLLHVGEWFARPDSPHWLVSHCMRIGRTDDELGRIEAAAPRSLAGFLMHDTGLLPLAGTFYRRELLEAYGPFDAALHYAFDYELSARLLAAGRQPTIAARLLAARREDGGVRGMDETLRCGREYVDAAMRHADELTIPQRYALWRNCEQRRRIYALAEAEAASSASRRLLWQRLLHHPWWLANSAYRHALLHGAHHPDAPIAPLPAA